MLGGALCSGQGRGGGLGSFTCRGLAWPGYNGSQGVPEICPRNMTTGSQRVGLRLVGIRISNICTRNKHETMNCKSQFLRQAVRAKHPQGRVISSLSPCRGVYLYFRLLTRTSVSKVYGTRNYKSRQKGSKVNRLKIG